MKHRWITSRLAVVTAIVAVAIIQVVEPTQAQTPRDPVIRLSQTVGPPTTPLTVEGAGFGNERIALFFDAERVAAVFTETGRFRARFDVPGNAPPGLSLIRAVGQTTNAAAQTSFKVQADWLQLGFNSRHVGLNPFENVIGAQNANNLTTAWVVPVSTAITFLTSSPSVVDDVLYSTWTVFGSDFSSVGAFDVQTGALLWEAALFDQLGLPSSPAFANGLVYVSTKVSFLYALDPKTGITQWSALTSFDTTNVGSPVTDGARVYQATGDCSEKTHGEIQARDAVTGAFLWSQSIGVCAVGSPTVGGGMLYMMGTSPQSIGRRLYAFVAATGAPSWSVVLKPQVFGSPVLASGRLYVNGYHELRTFDASNGNILWTTSLISPSPSPDPAGEGSPAVAYGKVYLGSGTGRLYAMDAASGQAEWSAQVPFSTGSIDAAAAIANQVVYVQAFAGGGGQYDVVAGFDANSGVPVFYAVTDNNTVVSNAPHPSVVVVNGRVFVGSEDGRIFAFKLP